MSQFCVNCGEKMDSIAEICPKCGFKVKPNSQECNVLTGLLDFYSDRAVAHASFVIAATFGIYTLLFSVNGAHLGKNNWELGTILLIYLPLLALDIYSFLNFFHYASQAHLVQMDLLDQVYQRDNWIDKFGKRLGEEYPQIGWFKNVKHNKFFRWFKQYVFIPVGLFLTGILPLIYVYVFMWK